MENRFWNILRGVVMASYLDNQEKREMLERIDTIEGIMEEINENQEKN